MAPRDLNGTYLQCFLVNAEVDFSPYPPFGATMLAGVPLAFALDLDARAVDEQVQRAFRPPVGDVDSQRLLTARQGVKIWHRPVEADQLQQAFDEPGRLPQRHA